MRIKLQVFQLDMVCYSSVDSYDYLFVYFKGIRLNNRLWTEFIWSFVKCNLWLINSRLT